MSSNSCPEDHSFEDLLAPPGYSKEGEALYVEQAVQAATDNPPSMDTRLGRLALEIDDEIPGSGTTPSLRKTRSRRQAVIAVTATQVCLRAIPTMTRYHREHGTLSVPEDWEFDPYKHETVVPSEEDPALFRIAFSGAYWLATETAAFLGESAADSKHAFHRLHHHLEETWEEYRTALVAYEDEHGRDPVHNPGRALDADYTYEDSLIDTITKNVGLGISAMVAKAINHIIFHEGPQTIDALDAATRQAIPRIRWAASAERHTGLDQARRRQLSLDMVAGNAGRLLARQLETADSITELIEPLLQYRDVNDRDFCPTEKLRHGPIARAGHCPADVDVIMRDEAAKRKIRVFYGEMGVPKLDSLN